MSNFFSSDNNESNNLFKTGFLSNENASSEETPQIDFFADVPKPENEQPKDNSLQGQYKEIQTNYEQIFIEAAESIRKELDTIKPENACDGCAVKDCAIQKKDIFAPYPPAGCKLREWQMQAITYLTGDYRTKLKAAYKAIMDKRENYQCNRCGDCCRLAVSEYSYAQLKQRAMRGDKYSEDFVSVFVPYESEEEAKKVNPEYFELLNTLVDDQKIYYYYCPKISDDNLCTMYEDRPDICKDFPYNPLKLLPSRCSYNEWKNEVAHQAMLLKAKTDIINFYKEKLG